MTTNRPHKDYVLDAPTDHSSRPFGVTDSRENPNGTLVSNAGPLIGPGACVAGYEILGEIARGGMGVVFRARQTKLNRIVAVKMLLDAVAASEEQLLRFYTEATAAAALDHPGIVPVYEVGAHDGHPFFAMAYVEGKSLAELLREGPLPPIRSTEIARDVARAIAHAHRHQVIHRDLKPANILIDTAGAVRVTDFGVCKVLSSAADMTVFGELVGTPHFMPPEQAGAKLHSVCPASDVYSIGAVLYAMLTGRPPFQSVNPVDVVSQVLLQEPVPPQRLNRSVPGELEVITLKCLNKSPKDRYSSADALADDLDRHLAGQPIMARPPGLVRRIAYLLRRHVFLASVSGTVALALLILAVVAIVLLVAARAQLAEMQELLANERSSAVRYARLQSGKMDHEISLAAYNANRLSDSAARLQEVRPDQALQLAIEAASISHKNGITVPEESLRILNAAVVQDVATSADPPDTEDLITRARRHVQRPFSEFERATFGIAQEGTNP